MPPSAPLSAARQPRPSPEGMIRREGAGPSGLSVTQVRSSGPAVGRCGRILQRPSLRFRPSRWNRSPRHRVMHADVDSRVGDAARQQPDRHGQRRQVPADRVGERERRRRVAGREGIGFRHRHTRAANTAWPARSGRSPLGERLHAEIDRRRGHPDRQHALQRRAASRACHRARRSRRRHRATGASSSPRSRAGERDRPAPGWEYPPQPHRPPGPPPPAHATPPPTRIRRPAGPPPAAPARPRRSVAVCQHRRDMGRILRLNRWPDAEVRTHLG